MERSRGMANKQNFNEYIKNIPYEDKLRLSPKMPERLREFSISIASLSGDDIKTSMMNHKKS
jgi:hypothetical protein